MKLSLSVALLAILVISGCAANDQATGEPTDAAANESIADNADRGARPDGSDADGLSATCEPERAQDTPSPGRCASVVIGSTNVEVQYSSPSKKDRQIFGGLVPNGEVWRTGANEATVLKTDGPLTIGGQELAAGSYGLFTIPGDANWTIIFNSVSDQWGAFDYDAAQDVLRTEAAPGSIDEPQEQFTISFEPGSGSDATMLLTWDNVQVPVPLAVSN